MAESRSGIPPVISPNLLRSYDGKGYLVAVPPVLGKLVKVFGGDVCMACHYGLRPLLIELSPEEGGWEMGIGVRGTQERGWDSRWQTIFAG